MLIVSTLSVGSASEGVEPFVVLSRAAGEEVADEEVCAAEGLVKWTLRIACSVCAAVRSMVMGIAGLWYFRRTISSRQNFLLACQAFPCILFVTATILTLVPCVRCSSWAQSEGVFS